MSLTKYIVGGAILAGGGLFLLQMRRMSRNLESITTANIKDISFTTLTIEVNVQLKNPTDGKITLNYPFIRLNYKGQTIGSSQATRQAISIQPHAETAIRGILIRIPLLSLTGLAKDFIKLLKRSPDGIALQVTTITTIQVALGNSIPYEKTESITLKQAASGTA